MEIGAIIKKARNEAKLTQEEAAEALGVSRQTVSNWETGKFYPDIISVIKMSDLYSVSLDCLLKEETSMKQTYREYLEESTNIVKSRERQEKLMLVLAALGVWSLTVVTFAFARNDAQAMKYVLQSMQLILAVTVFAVSFVLGVRNHFGKCKWIAPAAFGIMYAATGYTASMTAAERIYNTVVWPDFTKLPVGFVVSVAGIVLGILARSRKKEV